LALIGFLTPFAILAGLGFVVYRMALRIKPKMTRDNV
jgi:hypothetical protein